MSERNDVFTPTNNPHKISLYYITKGSFATITLDLAQADFELTKAEKQALVELPLKRDKCYFTDKKVVLVTLRDTLLDVLEPLMIILTKHTT